MFSKVIKTFKTSSFIRTPNFFNSTSTPYPLLFKAFPNHFDTSSSFIIKQLEKKELHEATICISEAFTSREMITKNFNIQNSQIYEKIHKELEIALIANLCFVCRDQKSNKLAGVVYYEDLSEPIICEEIESNSKDNLSKLMEFYNHCFSALIPHADPKERNDVLLFKKLAVAEEFTRLGVASNLIFAGRYIHPRTTKAKKSLMIASCKKTYEFCLKHGWELIKEIHVKDYKDGSFAGNGVVYLMKYEPKYVKTLIQELKSFFEN